MSTTTLTLTYSRLGDLPLDIELSLPPPSSKSQDAHSSLPIVLYFHGGGLVGGGKQDLLFPTWLKDLSLSQEFAFAGVDYPLIYPLTAQDEITQLKALFSYIASPDGLNKNLSAGYGSGINPSRIAVVGVSGGAYLCRLAALYCTDPKPAAVISAFGMGGDSLTDAWVNGRKDDMPFPSTPRDKVAHLLEDPKAKPSVDSPVILDQATMAPSDESGRLDLFLWMMENGVFLDYLTGRSGLSKELSSVSYEKRHEKIVKLGLQDFFPEIALEGKNGGIKGLFPPTFFYHGGADTFILEGESTRTYQALKSAGVKTELVIVDGAGHGLVDVANPAGGLVEKADEVQKRAFEFVAVELSK